MWSSSDSRPAGGAHARRGKCYNRVSQLRTVAAVVVGNAKIVYNTPTTVVAHGTAQAERAVAFHIGQLGGDPGRIDTDHRGERARRTIADAVGTWLGCAAYLAGVLIEIRFFIEDRLRHRYCQERTHQNHFQKMHVEVIMPTALRQTLFISPGRDTVLSKTLTLQFLDHAAVFSDPP